jgi:fructosamine-3-kinase
VEDETVDLAYLRAHPEHLPTFLTHQRIRETPVAGGNVCAASRLTLDDGNSVFAKTWPSGSAPAGFFAAEAAGLRWLRAADAAPVPTVLVDLPSMIAMEWIEPGEPTAAGAERFGRELAELHRSGADTFGAGPPAEFSSAGAGTRGFIGPLAQDDTPDARPWGPWFGERRLWPYLKKSCDDGALSAADVALVERVISRIAGLGGDEPPARLHGDLWPGNLLWAADGRAWLVDPAAHGGHRETDLAQLALFGGAPHLDTIIRGYAEVWPLADGWRKRVPVHQLHLLLVHAAAFGAAYGGAVRGAAGAALRA